MKELDFKDCKWLRKYLDIVYSRHELDECNNICHLTSMIFKCTIVYCAIFAGVANIGFGLVAVLSLTTLMLPDGWQASLALMELGLVALFFILVVVVGVTMVCILRNEIPFAPKWLSEPTTKLWQKVYQNTKSNTTTKEKSPNKFIILVKEVYNSIKDKTCVKVRL